MNQIPTHRLEQQARILAESVKQKPNERTPITVETDDKNELPDLLAAYNGHHVTVTLQHHCCSGIILRK